MTTQGYRRTSKFDGSFFLTGSLSIEPAAIERNVIEIKSWPMELVPTPLAAVTLAPYSANRAWRGKGERKGEEGGGEEGQGGKEGGGASGLCSGASSGELAMGT